MAWIGTATPKADRLFLQACAAVFAVILISLLLHIAVGWVALTGWALACGCAAWKAKATLWASLVAAPLSAIGLSWLYNGYPSAEDPFGFMWTHIIAFITAAFVTAATGCVLLIQSSTSR